MFPMDDPNVSHGMDDPRCSIPNYINSKLRLQVPVKSDNVERYESGFPLALVITSIPSANSIPLKLPHKF